jgi:hypothetical protein
LPFSHERVFNRVALVGANLEARVARWFIFKPNPPIWVHFRNVDIFYGHFEYFTDIWDILRPFGTFGFTWNILVSCTEKNLATLQEAQMKAVSVSHNQFL